MATTIKLKNGSGAPLAADLVQGEPAFDLTNKRLYTENASGTVIEIGTSPSTIDINAGTIDGVTIGGASAGAGTFTTGQFNTSLNVDGTVTADGLTVDGNTTVDAVLLTGATLPAAGNPSISLRSSDNVVYHQSGSANTIIMLDSSQNTMQSIGATAQIWNISNSEQMRLTSTGLGIGTTSPLSYRKLTLQSDGTAGGIALNNSAGTLGAQFTLENVGTSTDLGIYSTGVTKMYTGGTERMRIDSSGNVGIGTTSLDADGLTIGDLADVDSTPLSLRGNGYTLRFKQLGNGGDLRTEINSASSSAAITIATNNTERLRITSTGNVGIGTTNNSSHSIPDGGGTNRTPQTAVVATSGVAAIAVGIADGVNNRRFGMFVDDTNGIVGLSTTHSVNAPTFVYRQAGAERLRIDSSGNLLVGTTDFGVGGTTGTGIALNPNGPSAISRSSNPAITLNRTTSDGDIALFRKDGSNVGSIGNLGSTLRISGSSSSIYVGGTGAAIWPTTDNSHDLGTSGLRFDDIYASNGTIITSDRNEKQDIEALSDAEQRVAVAAKGLLRKYRWKDAVAEKGDAARIHFGIIAQDLQAAFEAEGLDAGRYGMFIHSTWTDEETGEERSRMGVRYSELLAFIIAAI